MKWELEKYLCFHWDTIKDSAGMKVLLEMIYQFCYINDIDIIGINEARQIMTNTPKSYAINYFPNTPFRQTIKNTYGTENERSNLPDSFVINTFDDITSTISVNKEEVNIEGVDSIIRTLKN